MGGGEWRAAKAEPPPRAERTESGAPRGERIYLQLPLRSGGARSECAKLWGEGAEPQSPAAAPPHGEPQSGAPVSEIGERRRHPMSAARRRPLPASLGAEMGGGDL